MKSKTIIILLALSWITQLSAAAQTAEAYPVIGKPIPAFTLTNVQDYTKTTFSPSDAKGKWLVLDFWNKYCVSCVASFPEVNRLQQEFKDNVQYVLIGRNIHEERDVEQVYDRYEKKLGLHLANAYDTTLIDQFGVNGYPFIVVVDPQSVVYAITSGPLSQEFMRELVAGKKPTFKRKYSSREPADESAESKAWKYGIPWYEIAGDSIDRKDFLYRSVLNLCHEKYMQGSWAIDTWAEKGCFFKTKIPLLELFNIAYWGESRWNGQSPFYTTRFPLPVVEVKDPALFHFDGEDLTGYYNYSLIVPKEKSSREYLMEVMQRDLKNYFGYEVSYETRRMPYWSLTATEETKQKLRSKFGKTELDYDATMLKGKCLNIAFVLAQLDQFRDAGAIPMIDETNIKYPVDLSYSANMMDILDVRKELAKQGLILEKKQKEFQVLVIRDPKPAVALNK